jgi:hypothetical protein
VRRTAMQSLHYCNSRTNRVALGSTSAVVRTQLWSFRHVPSTKEIYIHLKYLSARNPQPTQEFADLRRRHLMPSLLICTEN